jgi:hypothetical protein
VIRRRGAPSAIRRAGREAAADEREVRVAVRGLHQTLRRLEIRPELQLVVRVARAGRKHHAEEIEIGRQPLRMLRQAFREVLRQIAGSGVRRRAQPVRVAFEHAPEDLRSESSDVGDVKP